MVFQFFPNPFFGFPLGEGMFEINILGKNLSFLYKKDICPKNFFFFVKKNELLKINLSKNF